MNITQEGEEQYKIFTGEKLAEIIKECFSEIQTDKKFSFGQGCKTNGLVIRDAFNLNLCNDVECKSCREIEKLWKQAKKTIEDQEEN